MRPSRAPREKDSVPMDPRLHDLHEPLHHHLNQHLHHSSPASPIISPHVPLSPAMAARYAMFHSDPTPLTSSASFERIESLSGSSHAIRSGDFIAAASSSSTLDESMSPSSSSILRRVIVLGETHANRSYCSNKLQTAKYETTWQLLVYGLISCIFSSVASVYFFTVGLLQIFTPWRYLHDAHLTSARELELIQTSARRASLPRWGRMQATRCSKCCACFGSTRRTRSTTRGSTRARSKSSPVLAW